MKEEKGHATNIKHCSRNEECLHLLISRLIEARIRDSKEISIETSQTGYHEDCKYLNSVCNLGNKAGQVDTDYKRKELCLRFIRG